MYSTLWEGFIAVICIASIKYAKLNSNVDNILMIVLKKPCHKN